MHSPTLESVLMVEEAIQQSDNDLGKYQLWKTLPKKMMYQTYQAIIDYLIASNKVLIDQQGKLFWIFNPTLVKKVMRSGVKLR